MDPDTESVLVSTCLALGGFEDQSENPDDTSQVYVMGDECLGMWQRCLLMSLAALAVVNTTVVYSVHPCADIIIFVLKIDRVFEGYKKVHQVL